MRNFTIETLDKEGTQAQDDLIKYGNIWHKAEMVDGNEQLATETNEAFIIKYGFDLCFNHFVDNAVRLKVEQLSFKRKQLIGVQTALIYKLEDWERKEFMAMQSDLIKQIQEDEAHLLKLKGENLYFRTWGNKRGAYEV